MSSAESAAVTGDDLDAAIPAVERTQGAGLGSVRRRNSSAVLQTVLRHGAVARSDIARLTGLSATSVTKITAQMMADRVLRELPSVTRRDAGRPRIPVALDPDHFRLGGIHIGLRRTTAGLMDLTGNVVHERAITHADSSPEAVFEEVRELRAELESEAGGAGRLLGMGVSTGGWVDPARGMVLTNPVLGWHDVAVREALSTGAYPVHVDGAVRALAMAETLLGAARDSESALFLFVGNVVGVAHVIDGRVRLGRDSAAGLIDHLPVGLSLPAGSRCECGRSDCFAALASDLAVLGPARAEGIVAPGGTFEDVIAASRAGDERAHDLLRRRAEAVGSAAATLMNLYDPDLLILGGGLLQAPEHLDALRVGAAQRLSRPAAADRIVETSLGPNSLVRGCAGLALDAFLSDPTTAFVR